MLKISIEDAVKRIGTRKNQAEVFETEATLKRVAAGYDLALNLVGWNVKYIDASREQDIVYHQAREIVEAG